MPLHLDSYYLHGLSSLYVYIVVPECCKNVVSILVPDRSFKEFLSLKFEISFLSQSKVLLL